MNVWKIIGLAGVVGVAAFGVAAGVGSVQRKHREYVDAPSEELRDRLQERLLAAQQRQAG